MKYYFVEPEVPGQLGKQTVVRDDSVFPHVLKKLHFEFHGWPEDVLVTSFGAYILKREALADLKAIRPSGVEFDNMQSSQSDEFRQFYPDCELPEFVWLKITGKAGRDDFGIASAPDRRLVVSGNVMSFLLANGICHADIDDYPQATQSNHPPDSKQPQYVMDPNTGQKLRIGDVLTEQGLKCIVHSCDYTTGRPVLMVAEPSSGQGGLNFAVVGDMTNEEDPVVPKGEIRKLWDQFYREHPPGFAKREDFIQKAAQIDALYGFCFQPSTRGGSM